MFWLLLHTLLPPLTSLNIDTRLSATNLPYFAIPFLTELTRSDTHTEEETSTLSLAPLSALVNLTRLGVFGIAITEPDAEVISGLTNIENLYVQTTCEACFTHMQAKCRHVDTGPVFDEDSDGCDLVGDVALQALVGHAATTESLDLPPCVDPQDTVSQSTNLSFLYIHDDLSDGQGALLRSCLPRLEFLLHDAQSKIVCHHHLRDTYPSS